MITSVRIIHIGTCYEAFIRLKDGSSRLITSDTLSGIFKEIEKCQV